MNPDSASRDPSRDVHPPKRPRRRRPRRTFPPEVLTNDEVLALMDACPAYGTGLRNRALIAVLYRSGLRLSEAIELCSKDVDASTGQVAVLRGKGGRWRVVGIDPGALAHVAAWASVREAWGIGPAAPLLCTKYGTRLTPAYVRRLLPKLAGDAGILHCVHAHGLRHTMAAQLRAECVDIAIISRQLGHRSIFRRRRRTWTTWRRSRWWILWLTDQIETAPPVVSGPSTPRQYPVSTSRYFW